MPTRSSEWADFYANVNGAALSRYPDILYKWLPAGQVAGNEFEVGNVNGSAGKSLKINTRTGIWADFAGSQKGSDPISLYAEINHLKQGEAGQALGRELGIEPPGLHSVKDKWIPIVPIPADKIPIERLPGGAPEGERDNGWLYFDAEGRPLIFRIRFNLPDGKKAFAPLTWCRNSESGQCEWRWKDLPAPRPLYNLEKLNGEGLAKPVLVVEGEKCAEAGETLLGAAGWVVVTWAGGAKRAGKKDTDWTPLKGRKVWIWPDNDEPGREAALQIAKALEDEKPTIVKMAPKWSKGHDLADLVAEGWDATRTLDWIHNQNVPTAAIRAAVVVDRGVAQGDIFIADRFLAKHREDVRYCPTRGWLIWDGRRWAWDEREAVIKLGERVVRDLYAEAAEIDDERARMELVKFATSSSRIDRIRGALALARPHVAVVQGELDQGGFFLNCRNGTVDLRSGEIMPHAREDLITRLIDLDYDEDVEADRFERFLLEIFDQKTDLVEYIHRAIGYSFTANQREQCLHFLHGAGANGKSTLIDVLLKVAGEYGQTAPAEVLLLRRNESIPTDIARMCGARFIAMSETGEARALDEAAVKKLTSVEPIPARFLHQNTFEFIPSHHLWLSSNHKPHISGTDLGIWRRIRLIPFSQTFPIDGTLAGELESELPGILSWVVRGAAHWFAEERLTPTSEIAVATAQYRSEQDILEEFLRDCCEVEAMIESTAKSLYDAYKSWAKDGGEQHPWSRKLLGRRLGGRGFVSHHTRVGDIWRGLKPKI